MAALGVDEYRVHAHGVDLPLPPHAHILGAAHAVVRVAVLEHEAFGAQAARGLALKGQVLPVGALQKRAQAQGLW